MNIQEIIILRNNKIKQKNYISRDPNLIFKKKPVTDAKST